MAETQTYAGNLDLLGGWDCLDFVNTLDGRRTGQPYDYLNSYIDLALWGQHVGLVTEGEAQQIMEETRDYPAEAAQVFEQAIALRETIHRIFVAITGGERPDMTDLALLNELLLEVLAQLQIVPATEGFAWDWRDEKKTLDWIVWSLARSAAELLTSEKLKRVRECEWKDCGWLFVDTSRNRSRRWCDMKSCGNRAKAQSYYQRKRMTNSP